jgi:hypothetical protein
MHVVLQAVGRVRPYTRPREIITFQCAQHPQLAYSQEFSSIGEAREFFEISDRRTRKRDGLVEEIQRAKAGGQAQVRTALILDVSLRTVKRYWNIEKVPKPL